MKYAYLMLFSILLIFIGCSNEEDFSHKNILCEYKSSIGGCEEIFYDGNSCKIINEGYCTSNEYKKFDTLEECQNLCE